MTRTTDLPAAVSPEGVGEPNMYARGVFQPATPSLLQLDLRARVLELFLDLRRFVLAHIGLHLLGSALDEVFRFLEAKSGDRADFLDHVDLLVARRGENDREFGLLDGG